MMLIGKNNVIVGINRQETGTMEGGSVLPCEATAQTQVPIDVSVPE